MLRIGSRISFDNSGRITVPKELADMMNLSRGGDLVYWTVEDGKAVLRKATTPLYGIDIEAEEIEANLKGYESRLRRDPPYDGLSEAQRRDLARKEYERIKAERRRPKTGRDFPFHSSYNQNN